MTGDARSRAGDWNELVRRQARAAHVDLAQSTIDELAHHLEDVYASARAEGQDEAAARRRAVAALEESALSVLKPRPSRGPRRVYIGRADETARISGGRGFSMLSAVRMALRQFRRYPGFALIVVLVLGLGTAAATTIFAVVNSVVLRPLPYASPDRLVTLWDANVEKGLAHDPISPVNFMDYRALPVFSDAAAWWRPSVNLVDPGLDPIRVNTIEVSGNLFRVLGIEPQVGAGFPAGVFYVRNDPIVVISDRLWRARYGADPTIVGRQLSLNGAAFTVAGIMPPRFHFPDDVDIWQRLKWDLQQHSRAAHFMEAIGRLADDKTLEQAQSACDTLGAQMQRQFAATNKGWSPRLVPLLDEHLGYYRPALMVLFGAVGLLFLMACLNIASLLLTRGLSREREIAVRIAIGASPRHLITQLLAESLVLSASGATIGIGLALLALPLIRRLTPIEIPRLNEATVDLRALAVGLALGVGTTVF